MPVRLSPTPRNPNCHLHRYAHGRRVTGRREKQFRNAQPVVPVLLTPRPCRLPSFEVNSEPHTGARPSVRLCAGPELARCLHLDIKLQQHFYNTGLVLCVCYLEIHVFLGTRIDRKISARDALYRPILPARLFRVR